MRQKSPCDDPALHAGQRDGVQKRLVARKDERRRTLSGQCKLQCYVGGTRTRHTCTNYFKAVNFSSRKYRNSSSFLNGGDAPTATVAIVGPTNTYLLSSLNIDTFRLLHYVTSIRTY